MIIRLNNIGQAEFLLSLMNTVLETANENTRPSKIKFLNHIIDDIKESITDYQIWKEKETMRKEQEEQKRIEGEQRKKEREKQIYSKLLEDTDI